MTAAVTAEKLTKHYGSFKAVDGIDFSIYPGECFGFLGPNGAGKTTTVKMIYGFSPVTAGKLEVLGMDISQKPAEIKGRLGVVSQENNLDPDLDVLENLVLYARYFGIGLALARERASSLLGFMDLEHLGTAQVDQLSGGMQRRLVIARSLVSQPSVLVLDEPTTGLDPHARHLVWSQLDKLKSQGLTIILTTHYLEEARFLCDRLVIMDRGKILEGGKPEELIQKHVGREVVEINLLDREGNKGGLARLEKIASPYCRGFHRQGNILHLFTDRGQGLLSRLNQEEPPFTYQVLRPATLEDVFLKLTGKGLEPRG